VHQVGFHYTDVSRCTVNKTLTNLQWMLQKDEMLQTVFIYGKFLHRCCWRFRSFEI